MDVLRCLGSNNARKKCRTNYSVRRCYCYFLLCSHFPSRSATISYFLLLSPFLFLAFFCVTQVKTFRKEYETRPYAKNVPYCVHRHRRRVRLPLLRLLCVIWCRRHDRPPPLPQQTYLCMELHDFDIKIPETSFFLFYQRSESNKRTSR